eukprot:8257289-Pyramimonas_sp.AAC.1
MGISGTTYPCSPAFLRYLRAGGGWYLRCNKEGGVHFFKSPRTWRVAWVGSRTWRVARKQQVLAP